MGIIDFGIGYGLSRALNSALAKIIIVPLAITVASLFLYRYLRLFSKEDILKYAGNNKLLGTLGLKVLCRG